MASNATLEFLLLLLQDKLPGLSDLLLILTDMVRQILFPIFAVPQLYVVPHADQRDVVLQVGTLTQLVVQEQTALRVDLVPQLVGDDDPPFAVYNVLVFSC